MIPLAFSASSNAIGASNMNGFDPCECAGATGVSRLTKPKSAPLKTSLTSVKSAPQPWRLHPAVGSGSCGGAHRLVRNHVSGHGKADLRQLVRIWGHGGGQPARVSPCQPTRRCRQCCNQRSGRRQAPLPAQFEVQQPCKSCSKPQTLDRSIHRQAQFMLLRRQTQSET